MLSHSPDLRICVSVVLFIYCDAICNQIKFRSSPSCCGRIEATRLEAIASSLEGITTSGYVLSKAMGRRLGAAQLLGFFGSPRAKEECF